VKAAPELQGGSLLRAHGILHRFGRTLVLDDVSLSLSPGRLGLVLGPNGAGKTTLVRVLCGVLAPDSGTVWLDGLPLRSLSRREIARRVAVVPQHATTPFPFRVREIVAMARAPYLGPLGIEGPEDRAAVEGAVAAMGLRGLADRPFATLSGGERQRVLLARALAQATDVLLLDEPTAHMDLGHRLFVFESLRGWIARDPARRAALVVTHDLSLAAGFGDEVLLLDRGREVASGALAEVLRPGTLEAVYGADVEVRSDALGRPLVVALRSRIRYPAPPDGPHR
jgi:iron complex transport system ATP-binding protein